jgi:hypothetical protein
MCSGSRNLNTLERTLPIVDLIAMSRNLLFSAQVLLAS